MYVCTCACVRARARVCVCVHAHACVPVYMHVCMRECSTHTICLVNGGVNRCISGSKGGGEIHTIRVILIDVLRKSCTHESMNK